MVRSRTGYRTTSVESGLVRRRTFEQRRPRRRHGHAPEFSGSMRAARKSKVSPTTLDLWQGTQRSQPAFFNASPIAGGMIIRGLGSASAFQLARPFE